MQAVCSHVQVLRRGPPLTRVGTSISSGYSMGHVTTYELACSHILPFASIPRSESNSKTSDGRRYLATVAGASEHLVIVEF